MPKTSPHVAIIGAGIGGLAAALRLAHHGFRTTVLERHSTPGGKMRQVATVAGPVDAGPTVLTLKPVFEALFLDVGLQLDEVVTFHRQDMLARHFWHDGTTLDLMLDPTASRDNVHAAFGSRSAQEFWAFSAKAQKLFETFDLPMMQTPAPSLAAVARIVASTPSVIAAMDPMRDLAASLNRQFSDPRLAQLFARYATYVGGLPMLVPGLLKLIWHAESQGVWHVEGGMYRLAQCIAEQATKKGAEFHYDTHVTQIEPQGEGTFAIQTEARRFLVDAIVFNGDPRALTTGALGIACGSAVSEPAITPRSLSAHVMSFAATPVGLPLAAHNVFFAKDPRDEYAPLTKGKMQDDPTLYICAQDRFGPDPPKGTERFEIILNSPPLGPDDPSEELKLQCQTRILSQLKDHGLTFAPAPDVTTMTGPRDFDQMFPASNGSLYGRSPHGMMAAFQRPTARTAMKGLYLTGGGAHPGAGVPMAVLSAKHAAAAILSDLPLT